MSNLKHLSPGHSLRENANIIIRSAAMYGVMVLAYLGWVPTWGIVVANLMLYFSVYVSVHEIGHNFPVGRLSLVSRFIPVATPLWGGVRVFQETHRRHHLYFCTDQDPWLPFYAGSPLRALFFNLIEPEVNAFNFVKKHGVDRELVLNVLYNVVFLAGGLYVFGKTYLVYALSMRLIHGVAVFFFNFTLHRDRMSAEAAYSVYTRERLVKPVLPLARLIWGKAVVLGYMYHDRHHSLRQWKYHPLNYETLKDLNDYSPFIKQWPATSIQRLSEVQAQQDELQADMAA